VFFICFSRLLIANDSPNWHIDGVNDGWKDEFLALKYFHNSELQRQWAWHLLGSYHFTGNENILDFGCGDGKITAEISHLVPQGHILGFDSSSSMINFSKRCFPSIHYPNLTFEQVADTHLDHRKYDVVCSFCVFHLVPNPVALLKKLRTHLNLDGVLLLVVPAGNNPAFFQAANEIFDKYELQAPWSPKDSKSSNVTMRTKEGCIDCLAKADLEPVSVAFFHTPTAFFNKQELVEWMVGTVSANWQIPLAQADLFFSDLIDRMAALDSDVIDKSGAYYMKLSRLEVIAKPKN
jgi:trans-aconitate methyltransferase